MPRTASPPTVTVPESGARSPARIVIRVDFPEPVEPTIETNSPSSTVRCTPFRTSRTFPDEAKDFETFRTSTSSNDHSPVCLLLDRAQPHLYQAHPPVEQESHDTDGENAERDVRIDEPVVLLPKEATHSR